MEPTDQPEPSATKLARWLGFAGLIPFVAGTVLLIGGHIGVREFALEGLIAYGAIILGFMGAVHWGRAMFSLKGTRARKAYMISVLPALVGWTATFLAARLALAVLAAAFVALYLYDRATINATEADTKDAAKNPGANHNEWYLPLRLRLTCIVVTCLLLCLVLL